MIYHTVSAIAAPGREEEALKWLVKLAAYYNQNYAGHVEVCRSLDGRVSRMHWVGKVESLAVWEQGNRKWESDPEVAAMSREGQGLFSGREDHLYEIIA